MIEEEIYRAVRALAASGSLASPASMEAITEAEEALGFPLPPLLRRLFLEVANGGFGPPGGILGVRGCQWVGDFQDIAADYAWLDRDPSGVVPHAVRPIYDWGCNMWSMVDFSDPVSPMWGLDQGAVFPEGVTLTDWLSRALDGTQRPPDARQHPGARHLPR